MKKKFKKLNPKGFQIYFTDEFMLDHMFKIPDGELIHMPKEELPVNLNEIKEQFLKMDNSEFIQEVANRFNNRFIDSIFWKLSEVFQYKIDTFIKIIKNDISSMGRGTLSHNKEVIESALFEIQHTYWNLINDINNFNYDKQVGKRRLYLAFQALFEILAKLPQENEKFSVSKFKEKIANDFYISLITVEALLESRYGPKEYYPYFRKFITREIHPHKKLFKILRNGISESISFSNFTRTYNRAKKRYANHSII